MSALSQNNGETIQRSLSYNNLNKGRIARSMTNRGKFHAIHLQPLNKYQAKVQKLEAQTWNRKIKMIKKAVTVETIPKIAEHSDKQNQNGKLCNRLHLTSDILQKNQGTTLGSAMLNDQQSLRRQKLEKMNILQLNTLNKKKTKSTRILTKKIQSQIGGSKVSEGLLLKRINGCQVKDDQKQTFCCKKQQLNEYRSAPQNQINQSRTKQEENHLVINLLSPIKKCDIISIKRGEVSGQSLLFDIQQHLQQLEVHSKRRCQRKNVSEFKEQAVVFQAEQKMPKIMKRYLPKDFFLRG